MKDIPTNPAPDSAEYDSENGNQNTVRPFLECVAKAYTSRFGKDGFPNAEECCFVFPNKRAGTFFTKYLKDCNTSSWMLTPEITTISDFVTDISGRLVNNRIDLIFLLYNCYCEILDPDLKPEHRDKLVSFDSFRKWGETVLRDFNEIDMQIANAGVSSKEIFKNVADFKRISSSFLTPEQRKVIEEYFGYHFSNDYDARFWTDLSYKQTDESSENGNDPKGKRKTFLRDKFIELWKILYPLYTLYHKRMKERNLISSGGVYRVAVEELGDAIENRDIDRLRRLLPCKKLIMVGFNALSIAERQLFNHLKSLTTAEIYPDLKGSDKNFTDFVWDATGPVLHGDRDNSAGRFVYLNKKKYPTPEWVEEFMKPSHTDSLPPVLEAVASPSGVMQVKIATRIIKELHDKIKDKPFDEARVALVVPDENLLLPLLYSIPKELKNVNLTMGYPLRLTAVTSFMALLRRLQLSRRDSKAHDGFNAEQVSDILSHPIAQSLFPTPAINKFIRRIEREHINVLKYDVDFIELQDIKLKISDDDIRSPFEILFKPLPKNAASEEVIKYLDDILLILEATLSDSKTSFLNTPAASSYTKPLIKGNLELQHVVAWREALRCFSDSIREYNVKLGVAATLTEAYRLLQAEIVALEGEPLKGLQIMGMLETRALDFDYLIVVGLNDRTVPGRMRQRSFIPNIVRMGYGMPPNTYQEDLFGYYFYRMISRVKHATFIYDSRITGFTGGISRYLQQLRYIYAGKNLKNIEYKFGLPPREGILKTVSKKTPMTSRRLNEFFEAENPEKVRKLSASMLKTLTACPLKFYYKGLLNIDDHPAPTPAIDPITEGNVIHGVMQDLYVPEKEMQKKWLGEGSKEGLRPLMITKEYLEYLLSEEGREEILQMVKERILTEYYHRSPDSEWPNESDIQAGIMRNLVCDVLRYDLRFAPFNIYGVEVSEIVDYLLPDGRTVKIKYIIDRIDDIDEQDPRIDEETSKRRLRIVDYKTGRSNIETDSIPHLFESDYRKDNLLQLMLYSMLFNVHREKEGLEPINIQPRIYPVGRLNLRSQSFKQYFKGDKKGEYYREKKDSDRVPLINNIFIEDISKEIDDDNAPDLMSSFKEELDRCLTDLFDPEIPFEAKPDESKCRGCVFFNICGS